MQSYYLPQGSPIFWEHGKVGGLFIWDELRRKSKKNKMGMVLLGTFWEAVGDAGA